MSKPIKNMIVEEYRKRFAQLEGAVLIEVRGMAATANTKLRAKLRKSNVRVTVIKNTLAKRAFKGTPLEALAPGLKGPRAVVYGTTSVVTIARELVASAKENDKLALMGACIDGTWFDGAEGVTRLSKLPTLEEAQAQTIGIILAPARRLMGGVVSPGRTVLGVVKEVQTKLEAGDTIARTTH
ncbi:MAG: 50S ribosomal protein L10 [Phycisphaerales bacterium]|nr:50S ribosomal protein L10 [Phycisphaerales bacterium]